MKTALTALTLALLVLASPVLAQEGEEEEKFDMAAAMKKVAELLKMSEQQIVDSLKKKATAAEAEEGAKKAREALDELLRQSRKSGQDAVEKMTEILKKAPRSSGGGGGGSQKSQEPEKGDPNEPQDQPDQLDPGNSGDPKDSQKNESEQTTKTDKPPPAKTDKPSEPDPLKDWLALLPPQLRDKYKNKSLEDIPQRWREFLEEYAKRLAELESSRDGD